ncbi:hypothetical protein SS1G_09588 [Sclerotinia sclerotiorum 1980 UF-70]|uniref:C2H2-type domain-containing protein n=2 Tax=Sclerotinia sclerotiorum (strain ATCC 18683 / 1980 / Ss-1) TaxID=665079 RepID=A7EW79_SCLS1|nr:hypothetical protein SS1G_09588 [Sclerotinia sclerotiorum 1980 UF-70]APA15603.1 hypothetical protein sscle_15g103730 [Sclerotinia sclerotiorum 1980 UF-70]EDN93721.1 hypothetical protein SS1G_09588 [Sclerotinia sclerotiorum 1980 UF-70]
MELTPQSTRSLTPPFTFSGNSQPLFEYPSPAQSESRYGSTDSIQGLELYSCPMSGSPPAMGNQDASLESGGLSSVTSDNWADTTLQSRDTPRSSRSTPNIHSAEYDPFASYNPPVSTPFTTDIYTTSQTAEASILPASPLQSGNNSHRSSLSSAPPSEIFTQAGSIHSYTPRIKMEDHSEYVPSSDSFTLGSPHNGQHSFIGAVTTYPGTLETSYYDQSPWAQKMEYTCTDLPPFSALPIPTYERRSESQDRSSSQDLRRPSVVARTRGPRKLTAKEDANFQCRVKGCGKLFGRSYNYKAHMETHDADREYPFPCPVENCTKKFVRKTDLQRHNQSVHMKQRNHKCDYCSRFFARKDTLRRHMEDGCSKRFDIETVDFRPQNYTMDNNSAHTLKLVLPPHPDQMGRPLSYIQNSHYSPPPHSGSSVHAHHDAMVSPLTSASSGAQYLMTTSSEHHNHEPVWSSQ